MKRIICAIIIALTTLSVFAEEMQLGTLTITPYVPSDIGDSHCQKLLATKLVQITTANNVGQGFDRRFIIVPQINVLTEGTTSTIPQKTSLKVEFTFCIGDGLSSALFKTIHIERTGVGDDHNKALYSAIRKIRDTDPAIQSMIEEAKVRIVEYYNKEIPSIIESAKNDMASQNYEAAMGKLAVVPSVCERYADVQKLIQQCGAALLVKKNKVALQNAKAAWAANPTSKGAEEAKEYLAAIVITNKEEENTVNEFINEIRTRMEVVKDNEMQFEIMKMESNERIRTEEIQASAQTASSFFNMLPQLAYSIIGWFL